MALIEAVLWDMGGVLLRTEDWGPRERLAQRLGRTRQQLEDLVFGGETGKAAQLGQISDSELWQTAAAALGVAPEDIPQIRQEFFAGDVLDRALVDTIRKLRGQVVTGVISNAWINLRETILLEWKIADAFDDLVISAEVGITKPDAAIYRLALDRLGLPAQGVAFVDDFERNVDAAAWLGIHAIHFRSAEQTKKELKKLLDKS